MDKFIKDAVFVIPKNGYLMVYDAKGSPIRVDKTVIEDSYTEYATVTITAFCNLVGSEEEMREVIQHLNTPKKNFASIA